MEISNEKLNISKYRNGFHHFKDIEACNFYIKGAEVSFEHIQKHKQGVALLVTGSLNASYEVYWKNNPDAQGFKDDEEAAEYGAYGFALILIDLLTEYSAVNRAKKGGGFDFELKEKNKPLEPDEDLYNFMQTTQRLNVKMARLEVSGTQNTDYGRKRVKDKIKQTKVSDSDKTPAYIIVVDFQTPKALTAYRNISNENA